MRILIISQYFPPETGGPQNRIVSIARGLVEAGHDVHVITEKPNYPTGIIWPEYRQGLFIDRKHDQIPVTYVWIWEDRAKRFLTRIRFYISFVVLAVWAAARIKFRFDIVLASSPPLFVGIAGWVASRMKRARFVFDVRDLWPDVAVAMGELKHERAVRLAKAMERLVYRKAHGITAVTQSFCDDIAITAGENKAVVRIMNGTVPELYRSDRSKSECREKLGLPNCFIVTFAGNMGLAQGLDHVLGAAEILLDVSPDACILLVGDGVARQRLIDESTRRRLHNVRFVARVTQDEAACYMAASDSLLVPLAQHEIFRKFIPSKLFDSMACGRPVLLSVDGESLAILDEAGAGIYYPAEDGRALANAILELKTDPRRGEAMGLRGARYAAEHFSRSTEALKMAHFLEAVAAGQPFELVHARTGSTSDAGSEPTPTSAA